MRQAFIEELVQLAGRNGRIFLLTADLGWSVLERFADAYPDRFLNVGVAEQNMMGIATGLARAGYLPYVYSIATFSTLRCYEQLRDGPVLHGLPVRVIGMGGGFSYGHAGATHHALEDLAVTRIQPGLTVIAPADREQARTVMRATAEFPGPIYLRLDKNAAPEIPGLHGRFCLETPELVRTGADLLILATGSIAQEAVKAADILERRGLSAAVAVLAHLPFSAGPALCQLLNRFTRVMTVEEGFTAGGLASLTALAIAQYDLRVRLSPQGVSVPLAFRTGTTQYMRRQYGLDADSLANAAHDLTLTKGAAA